MNGHTSDIRRRALAELVGGADGHRVSTSQAIATAAAALSAAGAALRGLLVVLGPDQEPQGTSRAAADGEAAAAPLTTEGDVGHKIG